MNSPPPLLTAVRTLLKDFVTSPIIVDGKLSYDKLQKPKLRAQGLVLSLKLNAPGSTIPSQKGDMTAVTDFEIRLCAGVIVAAFLNPIAMPWDYERWAESEKKRRSGKFFADAYLGAITKPTTIVDMHGKILAWYLPGLLLPHRVEELNNVTMLLKAEFCKSVGNSNDKSTWRLEGFTCDGNAAVFGAGKLSLSVGKLLPGHKRLQDPIYSSPNLCSKAIRKWLQMIDPLEQLLNEVLRVVHPEMWMANTTATQQLVQQLRVPLSAWPTAYSGMDVICNRVSPPHRDQGGAISFYDHLLSFGQAHHAKLRLDDFHAEFAYEPGTSILFPGKSFEHSVGEWSGGERMVIVHYSKDDVQERMGVARPSLPSQLAWWSMYS